MSKSKDHGEETHLNDKYIPTSTSHPLSIIDISSSNSKYVFSIDFKTVENKNIVPVCREILAKLKKYQAENPEGKIKRHYLKVPFDSEIHKLLYGGSSCYLYVPDFMSKESHERFY